MFRPLLLPCLLSSLSLAAALPLAHPKDGKFHPTPDYPRWLGDGDAPWDCFIGASNDGLDAIPVTGAVRSYEWTIARATLAPDGVTREMIVVNDQFPGPVLEANWGDIIEITVFNNITGPEEPTALHWHGMLQTGTPWADGTLGVSAKKRPTMGGLKLTWMILGITVSDCSWQLLHIPLSSGCLRHLVLALALQRSVHSWSSWSSSDLWSFGTLIRHRSWPRYVLRLGA